MQTLDLRAKSSERTGPREIGLPWSLLFIPILFIAAGLSVPYALVARRIQRRREGAFRDQLEARGRVIEWFECWRAMDEGRGTLIIERSLKGPVRRWWTWEDLYQQCPYSPIECMPYAPSPEGYRSFADWCRQRYTCVDGGCALLVRANGITAKEIDSLLFGDEPYSGRARWINVIPPESLRAKNKK
jgi:hypothetical protein